MVKLDPIEGISSILARHKLIKLEDLAALRSAFDHQEDIEFEDFLLEEGIVDKSELLQALSEYYGVAPFDVVGEFFDHHLMHLVPKDVLLEHLMIPHSREAGKDVLWVVAAEPTNPHLPVVLAKYLSHNFNFMVGLPQDIRDAIREYYDKSDTYQPYDIANQQMERSAQDPHEPDQLEQDVPHHERIEDIPLIIEETIDDYESR